MRSKYKGFPTKCSRLLNSRTNGMRISKGCFLVPSSLSASSNPSPKVARLRATFLMHFRQKWYIIWATIYEKSLTERSVRDFSGGRDLLRRGAPSHFSYCPRAISRGRCGRRPLSVVCQSVSRASSRPACHPTEMPHLPVRHLPC